MFAKQKTEDQDLEAVANVVRSKLTDDNVTPEEFAKYLDQYIKLATLQAAGKRHTKVSADVAATVAANLAGILIIINHERAHVVTSKALAFVAKLR
jgi:hypothetical protein